MKDLSIYLNFNYSSEFKTKLEKLFSFNFCQEINNNCLVITEEVAVDWPYIFKIISKAKSNINFQFIDFYFKEVELDRYVDSGIQFIFNKEVSFSNLPIVKYESQFKSLKPIFFLDRDGIINEDKGYVFEFSKEIIYKDIIEVIKLANSLNILVVIVTNQAGVARGKYSVSEVDQFHIELLEYFKSFGAKVDQVEICPFHFEKGIAPWNFSSLLRKPMPGMLLRSAGKLGGTLRSSLMIGDKLSDRITLEGPESILLKSTYEIDSEDKVFESRSQFCSEVQKYLNKMLDLS